MPVAHPAMKDYNETDRDQSILGLFMNLDILGIQFFEQFCMKPCHMAPY